MQQYQGQCVECQGSGFRRPQDRCRTCAGKKVSRERKVVEVHVDKGMVDRQKIVLNGEGDQAPNMPAGNVIFILSQSPHKVFQRNGNDLIMSMELHIVEALCGFQKVIKTLDNRQLVITSLPGEVVKHGDTKFIMNEGMPHIKDPFNKGKLIIQFTVKFPNSLPPSVVPILENCLPTRPQVMITDDAEECSMQDYVPQEQRTHYTNDYEDDNEGYSGPTQCASS